jgi:hypothetical protein
MKWVGHGAQMTTEELHRVIWWENLKCRFHVENLGVDKSITLKYNFK